MKTILWRIWKRWLQYPLGKEAREDISGSTASSWRRPSRRGCWGRRSGTGTPCPATCTRKMGSTTVRNPHAAHKWLVFSLWHLQQANSPPCKCWGVVFWPWKFKHCRSVAPLPGFCSAQGRHSEHTVGTFSVVSCRGVGMNWELWLPRALSGNPESSKLSRSDTVNIGWVAWLVFAPRGCSCQSCLCWQEAGRALGCQGQGSCGRNWGQALRHNCPLCSSLLLFLLWMQHSEAVTPLGINHFFKMPS